MTILALDLGLSCGCARSSADGMTSSTWRLAAKGDQAHERFLNLAVLLSSAIDRYQPRLVAYEELHFAGGGPDALVSYGGLRAVVLLCAARAGVRYLGVSPATWKRAAGLRAGSKAVDALASARRRWPEVEFTSADEAVSRWIAEAAAAAQEGP